MLYATNFMYSFMRRLVYQLKTWQNLCNKFLNKMFVRHSEIDSLPKYLPRYAWIDEIISPLKEKGEISMTLPLSITIDLDLEALKDILAQINATAQRSKRTWVAGIDGDIKNISSMKALTGVDVMVL